MYDIRHFVMTLNQTDHDISFDLLYSHSVNATFVHKFWLVCSTRARMSRGRGPCGAAGIIILKFEIPTWVLVLISITNDVSAMFVSFDKVSLRPTLLSFPC